MRSFIILALTVAAVGVATTAQAGNRTKTHNDIRARRHANDMPWHGPYYHREYSAPVALVVPPTTSAHTQWSWGVAQTRVMPTYHQFDRVYPGVSGYGYGGGGYGYGGPLYPTPAWPSHTDQFGVYPVCGPW